MKNIKKKKDNMIKHIMNKTKINDCFKQYLKEYYENDKEELEEKRKETITCGCGSSIGKYNASRHIRSKIHQKKLIK